jgi:protein-tyrosine phosphatase
MRTTRDITPTPIKHTPVSGGSLPLGRPSSPEDWWRTVCFATPNLLVSGDLDSSSLAVFSEQLSHLVELGVTDIIDVRAEASDEDLVSRLQADITYHHIATDDDGYARPDAWFESGVTAAVSALSKEGRKVFVHCHMGVNRAPSLTFAIMLALGYSPVESLSAIRTARPIAALIYAPDALAWWHRTSGATAGQANTEQREVADWMRTHPIDTNWVISRIANARPWS